MEAGPGDRRGSRPGVRRCGRSQRERGTYPASPLQAATSMAPLFGVAAAALVLGEPISLGFGLAVVLVVGGLVLVNRRRQTLPPAPE